MENIINWIAQRIKDEHSKHSKHNDDWAEIAAKKIFATYEIKLRKTDVIKPICDACAGTGIDDSLFYEPPCGKCKGTGKQNVL
jgi:DnaJ-class molecular chaperone